MTIKCIGGDIPADVQLLLQMPHSVDDRIDRTTGVFAQFRAKIERELTKLTKEQRQLCAQLTAATQEYTTITDAHPREVVRLKEKIAMAKQEVVATSRQIEQIQKTTNERVAAEVEARPGAVRQVTQAYDARVAAIYAEEETRKKTVDVKNAANFHRYGDILNGIHTDIETQANSWKAQARTFAPSNPNMSGASVAGNLVSFCGQLRSRTDSVRGTFEAMEIYKS